MTDADSETWLQERLGDPADDLYFAVLFAGPHRRPAAAAAAALYVELEAIATRFRDLNVARTKLAWWRDELDRLDSGRPAHPATKALAEAGADRSVTPLLDVITGMELVLLEGPVTDLATAQMRAERATAPFAVALTALLAPEEAAPGRFSALGEAVGLARLLGGDHSATLRQSLAEDARGRILDTAEAAREAQPPLQVLTALAWRRSDRVSSGEPDRRGSRMRVFTAWRAGRGRLPRALRRA